MFYIGLDIGGTKCAASLGYICDEDIKICDKDYFSTADKSPYKILQRFSLFIKKHLSKDIQGIGISCGGPLDSNTVINKGYIDDKYVLLYHINFGYPFLDEEMKIEMPIIKSEGLTDFARSRKELQLKITPPIDGGDEEVFYNNLEEGCVGLKSEKLGIKCELRYDIANFPVTLQWKSMISGDFALGIEPSVTRFDDFKMLTLKSQEKKRYSVSIVFEEEG